LQHVQLGIALLYSTEYLNVLDSDFQRSNQSGHGAIERLEV